jgi:hypothetical protein
MTLSGRLRFVRALQCLLLLAALQWWGTACAQAPVAASESAVKAAFLSKFAGFVEWPAGTLAQPDEPLVIGISGSEAVASDLQKIAAARSTQLRRIVVRRLPDGNGWSGVHILFIAASSDSHVREVAALVRGPVLVVTEQEDGLSLGAALNFVLDQGRVRFTAAPAAAEARGLRLSARLLALAQVVEGRDR